MISSEETKLKTLSEDNENRPAIEKSLRDLRKDRSARPEATSATDKALRSQITRIKQTITQILTGNTTLAERIKILFREQGVTIFSSLTALALAISTLVLALTGGCSWGSRAAASTPEPTPDPAPEHFKGGAKEWIKTILASLGRMLAWLGQKALSALPGLIGTLVRWFFTTVSAAGLHKICGH